MHRRLLLSPHLPSLLVVASQLLCVLFCMVCFLLRLKPLIRAYIVSKAPSWLLFGLVLKLFEFKACLSAVFLLSNLPLWPSLGLLRDPRTPSIDTGVLISAQVFVPQCQDVTEAWKISLRNLLFAIDFVIIINRRLVTPSIIAWLPRLMDLQLLWRSIAEPDDLLVHTEKVITSILIKQIVHLTLLLLWLTLFDLDEAYLILYWIAPVVSLQVIHGSVNPLESRLYVRPYLSWYVSLLEILCLSFVLNEWTGRRQYRSWLFLALVVLYTMAFDWDGWLAGEDVSLTVADLPFIQVGALVLFAIL